MQSHSPLYEDVYLLCEMMINDAVTSNRQIHLRSFYNMYGALHKFNTWFDRLLKGDFEKLFKETYFEDNMTIERWEQKHYWEIFQIFQGGVSAVEDLLLKLHKLRYVSNNCDSVIGYYMEDKEFYQSIIGGNFSGNFDEISMILQRDVLVIREGAVLKVEGRYDFGNNRIQLSETSKIILTNMVALENRMSSYLCKHARIEDIIHQNSLSSKWVMDGGDMGCQ